MNVEKGRGGDEKWIRTTWVGKESQMKDEKEAVVRFRKCLGGNNDGNPHDGLGTSFGLAWLRPLAISHIGSWHNDDDDGSVIVIEREEQGMGYTLG